MIARRTVDFGEFVSGGIRFDLEGDSRLITGRGLHRGYPACKRAGWRAYIHRDGTALTYELRLIGKPIYADDRFEAIAAIERTGPPSATNSCIEGPRSPTGGRARRSRARRASSKTCRNVSSLRSQTRRQPHISFWPISFDPGWSATVRPKCSPDPVRLRRFPHTVYLPAGAHTTAVFTYRPMRAFEAGGYYSAVAESALALAFRWCPRSSSPLAADHAVLELALAAADLVVFCRWERSYSFRWPSDRARCPSMTYD